MSEPRKRRVIPEGEWPPFGAFRPAIRLHVDYHADPRCDEDFSECAFLRGELSILTIEDYCKWYGLDLIWKENGQLLTEHIPFWEFAEDVDEFGGFDPLFGPVVDHVPMPSLVRAFAKKHGYHLCFAAFERIIGQWMLDVEERVP